MVLDIFADSNGIPYAQQNAPFIGFPFGPCSAVATALTPQGFALVSGLPSPPPPTLSHRHGLFVPPALAVGAEATTPHCTMCSRGR